MRDRLAIRHAIQRHRQIECVRLHAEAGAGECHALRITRQLKVGRGGFQRCKADVTVAENEHPTIRHAAMHAPGHLQNFVRAQVHAREHIAPAVDHVGESGVVDDDRIEPRHVQRALSGGRHGQEKRFRHDALEKRTDHANRFAAVIVRGRDAWIAQAHPLGGLFHRRARGQENRDATFRSGDRLQKLVVEKIQRLFALNFNLGSLGRIERRHLQHVGALKIARVKRGVDCR